MAGTVVVVPARMESTRLPGKPLADICGRPLILRVLDGASSGDRQRFRLVVATDSRQIEEVVMAAGYEAVLTGPAESGTHRVYDAWKALGCPGDRIVNLQGDEPFVQPAWIEALESQDMLTNSVVTLAREIPGDSGADPSSVKVVMDSGGKAMYFSRSSIPWGADFVYQHVGVYCFTPDSLHLCANSPWGMLSRQEKLEQLSWMESGVQITVIPGVWNAMGVDTPNDLEEARKWFRNR